MPHPPLALRQQLATTPSLSRRASLSALLLSPWLMPRVGAQVVQPVDSDGHSGVQLAMPWPAGRSPQGFGVSEKFDGVRAVWDGRVLRFRSGRAIAAPAWFLSALPRVALDGELWMVRGAFDQLSGVVRQAEPDDEAWRAVKYLVFDAPGHAVPFAQRMVFVQSTLAQAQQPWLMPVEQREVKDNRALQAWLQETVRQGGEGLMLHRADALWQPGRTDALFKLKPELDEEALVVGHQPGKGRLLGMTGALLVQTPSGQRFALGSGLSDAQRRNPPPLGAWVTYRYRDRTPSGLPRFASFLRVREAE
ncbi:DNA ligase [Limnohabitans sp. 63ED37-2]|uniref:DNA ligase n=1 Tax=Limnohabitans sp. 63ED37-2 TaxID=1678128 RepID=UPI000705D26F|nr:DNA ligase [Limnohabitans sp. 63ED37-2]ALK89589.1 DNA ligase [Limnohabitans sp. 63ED37-2]